MPRPGFFNDNRNRSFPFVKGTVGVNVPDAGLPTMRQLPDDWIVDCGFVMGPESGFLEDEHSIYLDRIWRSGSTVYFRFASDAPELFEVYLTFQRDITDDLYAVEHLDSDAPIDSSISDSNAVPGCREPLWEGYMISGDMSAIAARLADTEEIEHEDGDAVVEPALMQNLSNTIVNSFELANADRTRVTAPESCPEPSWPHQVGVIFEGARCLRGDILLKPGYNAVIQQNAGDNSIVIGANVGSGEGEPCSEVKLFDDESPPSGSSNNLLAGGLLCNETVRSINGIGGPLFSLLAGNGVSIIPDPENHKVTVDVNLIDLAVCYSDFSEISESV